MNSSKYIMIPFLTLIMCQVIKFIIESIKRHKLVWGRLFNGSGGMPSSHTSFSVSITVLIGLNESFNSPLFAVCLIFSSIVMYDAMGLRAQTGKQAEAINDLLDEVFDKNKYKHLKEQIGHKPFEVLCGIVFGTLSAVLLNLLFI